MYRDFATVPYKSTLLFEERIVSYRWPLQKNKHNFCSLHLIDCRFTTVTVVQSVKTIEKLSTYGKMSTQDMSTQEHIDCTL